MRSMYQVLLKQKRLQVASEGGTVEIRVSQFVRQWIPSCWRSHGKGTTTHSSSERSERFVRFEPNVRSERVRYFSERETNV